MPEVRVTGGRARADATLPRKRHAVRLTATNASGSDTETKLAYVQIGGRYDVELVATNTFGSGTETKTTYVWTGVMAGSPLVRVTGTRATATATAQTGLRPVIGVRAQATATARAGTVQTTSTGNVTVFGVRAIARTGSGQGWGKRWGINWGGSAGHILVTSADATTVTGVRATAAATGQAGAPRVLLPGAQAAAGANARLYSVRLTATNPAGSDTETKTNYILLRFYAAGTPLITITSPRGTATATGQPRGPLDSILGDRAAATSSAQPGTPLVAVTGARAQATATGQPGTVTLNNQSEVVLGGTRATATAEARPNAIQTLIGGQAAATATATPGSTSALLTGDRATSTATGTAGSPRVIVTGSRSEASANTAGVVYIVQGSRAFATATASPGQLAYDCFLFGGQGMATATALPGDPSMALPIITKRTGATGRRRNVVRARSGRTHVTRTH